MKDKADAADSQKQPWTQPLLTKHQQLHELTGKSAEMPNYDDPHDNGNHYGQGGHDNNGHHNGHH